jgi:hypothetical protein
LQQSRQTAGWGEGEVRLCGCVLNLEILSRNLRDLPLPLASTPALRSDFWVDVAPLSLRVSHDSKDFPLSVNYFNIITTPINSVMLPWMNLPGDLEQATLQDQHCSSEDLEILNVAGYLSFPHSSFVHASSSWKKPQGGKTAQTSETECPCHHEQGTSRLRMELDFNLGFCKRLTLIRVRIHFSILWLPTAKMS